MKKHYKVSPPALSEPLTSDSCTPANEQNDDARFEMETQSGFTSSTLDLWIQNESFNENGLHIDYTGHGDISSLIAVTLQADTSGPIIENQSEHQTHKNTFNTNHKLTRFMDTESDDMNVFSINDFTQNIGINPKQSVQKNRQDLKMISKYTKKQTCKDLMMMIPKRTENQQNCMSALDNNTSNSDNGSSSYTSQLCVGCRRQVCHNILATQGDLCLERSKEKLYGGSLTALQGDRASFNAGSHDLDVYYAGPSALDGYVWVENTDTDINQSCLNCNVNIYEDLISNPDKANTACPCIKLELSHRSVSNADKTNTDSCSFIKDQQLCKETTIDYTIKSSQISEQGDSDRIDTRQPLEKSINNKLHATSVMNKGREVKVLMMYHVLEHLLPRVTFRHQTIPVQQW